MTVAELIDTVLRRIAADFYAGRDQEFFRDQHALTRAIARYGVECQSRGWEFMPQVMQEDLLALLKSIRKNKADIQYLPVYLEGAVDRHIRVRADELRDRSLLGRNLAEKALRKITPMDIREATPVETLATLYKQMRRVKKQRKASLKPLVKEKQQSLL